MNKKERYLKLILSITLSSLLTVLVVFSVVQAQSYLREAALRVDGIAEITETAEIYGGTMINTGNSVLGLLVPFGKVGIGLGQDGVPVYKLDVKGDINFTGDLRKNGTVFSAGGAIKKVSSSACPSGELMIARRVESKTCTGRLIGTPPRVDLCRATSCTTGGDFWQNPTDSIPSCDYEDAEFDPTETRADACTITYRTCNASINEVACIGD